jgi:hypothetical protein
MVSFWLDDEADDAVTLYRALRAPRGAGGGVPDDIVDAFVRLDLDERDAATLADEIVHSGDNVTTMMYYHTVGGRGCVGPASGGGGATNPADFAFIYAVVWALRAAHAPVRRPGDERLFLGRPLDLLIERLYNRRIANVADKTQPNKAMLVAGMRAVMLAVYKAVRFEGKDDLIAAFTGADALRAAKAVHDEWLRWWEDAHEAHKAAAAKVENVALRTASA